MRARMTFWIILLIGLTTLSAHAQGGFTTVTAVVQDSNGSLYTNANFNVSFVNPGTPPGVQPLLNGSTFQTQFNGAITDSFGHFSIAIPDNNVIAISGALNTQWTFNFCSTLYASTNQKYCFNWTGTITGTTMDISAQLTAVAAILPISGGGGGCPSVGGALGAIQYKSSVSVCAGAKEVLASAYAGTTCGDKINNAITALGANTHILIDAGCPQGSAGSPGAVINSSVAGITLDFWQPGTWYFTSITLSGQASGIMALPCAENNITSLSLSCPTILYMGNGINPVNFVALTGGQQFIHDVTLYGNKANNSSVATVGLLMAGNRVEAARVQVQSFHGYDGFINGSPAPSGSAGCDGLTTCVAEGANLDHVQFSLSDTDNLEILNQTDVFIHFSKFENGSGWCLKATNATVWTDEATDFGGCTLGGAGFFTTSTNFNVWSAFNFHNITAGNNAGPAIFQEGWNGTSIANGPSILTDSSIANGAGIGTGNLIDIRDVVGVIIATNQVECVGAGCGYGISVTNNMTTGSTGSVSGNTVTGSFHNTNSAALGNNIPINYGTTATVTFFGNNENGASQNALTNARLLNNNPLWCTTNGAVVIPCFYLNSGNSLELFGYAPANRVDISPDGGTTLIGFTNTEGIFPNNWSLAWQNTMAAVNATITLNGSNNMVYNNGNAAGGHYFQVNSSTIAWMTSAGFFISGLANGCLQAAGFQVTSTGVACGMGSSSLTLATNGVNNSSQTLLNFITSSTNSLGLVATPFNSGGTEKFEITGPPTGNWDFSGATWKIPQGATFTASATSTLGIATTAGNLHAWLLAGDQVIPSGYMTGSWVDGDCPGLHVISGQFSIFDSNPGGGACASGGSSIFASYKFGSATAITGTGNYLTQTFPGIFSTTQTGAGSSGSPYVDALGLVNQSANTVFAGPGSGSPAAPAFRALVSADIPNNAASTTGNAATATAAQTTPTTCASYIPAYGINSTFNAQCVTNIILANSGIFGWGPGGTANTGLSRDSTAGSGVVDVGNGSANDHSGTVWAASNQTGATPPTVCTGFASCFAQGEQVMHPSPVAGIDIFTADYINHCMYYSANGAGYGCIPGTGGPITASTYSTTTNCSSSAAPAVCGSAAAGSVVVAAAATTVVVNTSAVTANSQIFVQYDSSLGTKLSVTCNTTAEYPSVTARSAGTSFTITIPAGPTTNPACYSFMVVN